MNRTEQFESLGCPHCRFTLQLPGCSLDSLGEVLDPLIEHC